MNVEIGDVIAGRYKLTKILGEGGMGAVYEANQINLNREVAVKVMHPAVSAAGDAKARFEREARVSGALHHPNAVKIFDFGEDDAGRLYLVMEKLRGTTLGTFVGQGQPPMVLGRMVAIALQIADVLVAAHKISLVHRDLKPENIFLETTEDGSDRVVVVDFGLAFIEEREDANRMTQEGMIMGTPFYMSPEQCKAKPVGPPCDIYAFGCMLYEMVTGFVPFDGPTVVLLTRHCFEEPIRPSERRKDLYVPRVLERLILSMMQKAPESRPPAKDVSAVLGQLEHTLGERERSRGLSMLEGREARMIPTVHRTGEAEPLLDAGPNKVTVAGRRSSPDLALVPDGAQVIAMVGAMPASDFGLALRANGYVPVSCAQPPLPPGTIAIYAPAAEPPLLRELLAFGVPVITDTDSEDATRVSELLTLGVAEIVTRPVRPEKLARKIARAVKKHARRAQGDR